MCLSSEFILKSDIVTTRSKGHKVMTQLQGAQQETPICMTYQALGMGRKSSPFPIIIQLPLLKMGFSSMLKDL